jgi:Zn-dependent metalloprotease
LSKQSPVERFGQAALDAQSEFLQRMPGVQIRYGANGAVSEVKGHTGVFLQSGLAGFKVNEPAKELLEKIGPALLAAGTEELRVFRIAPHAAKADPIERESSPERTVKTRQYIRGREVQLSSVNISLNTQTNEVVHLVANFLPDRGLPHEPKLTAAQARAKVEAAMRDSVLEEEQKLIFQDAPARLAYAFEDIGDDGGIGGALVWVLAATRAGEPLEANVNALTGEVVGLRGTFGFLPNRHSYTASYGTPQTSSFPTGLTFLFGESGPPLPITDQLAADAYSRAGLSFTAFDQTFGRNSWNNAGAAIKLVTHYGTPAGDARYGPGGYLIFADGSTSTKSGAEDLDVVTHEYGHGIVEAETGLNLLTGVVDGADAWNEAYGDWAATVPDVLFNGAPSLTTWQIGALNRNNALDGLRNLWIPKSEDFAAVDWFPSRTQIISGQSRYRNSTVMGHAFYLLANGGNHNRAGLPGSEVPVIPVTGIGYTAARNIFYNALFQPSMNSTAMFSTLKNATVAAASPSEQASVQQAWQAVGVGYNCSSAPQPPVITAWPHYCKARHDIDWPAVPGATRYDGQLTQANLGWAFAATIVDANVTSCYQDPPNAYWMVRVRACNGCGCSAWSNIEYLSYWSPCQ